MANRLRGEASFVHEGATLTMVLDTEALLNVEDATGIGLLTLIDGGIQKLGMLAVLLAEGVARGSGERFSRIDAAEILMTNQLAQDAVMEALVQALPEPQEADDGENPPQAAGKRGTGKKS